jgi:hypothetical protein
VGAGIGVGSGYWNSPGEFGTETTLSRTRRADRH